MPIRDPRINSLLDKGIELGLRKHRLRHLSKRLELGWQSYKNAHLSKIAFYRNRIEARSMRAWRAWFVSLDARASHLDMLSRRLIFAANVRITMAKSTAPPRAHRLRATEQAIIALYGRNGPPPGITEGQRYRAVNEWLRARGRSTVSQPTIRRALKALRARERY